MATQQTGSGSQSRVRAGAVAFLLQSFPRSLCLNHLAALIKNWMYVPKVTRREISLLPPAEDIISLS